MMRWQNMCPLYVPDICSWNRWTKLVMLGFSLYLVVMEMEMELAIFGGFLHLSQAVEKKIWNSLWCQSQHQVDCSQGQIGSLVWAVGGGDPSKSYSSDPCVVMMLLLTPPPPPLPPLPIRVFYLFRTIFSEQHALFVVVGGYVGNSVRRPTVEEKRKTHMEVTLDFIKTYR